jgi:hypothetical protein
MSQSQITDLLFTMNKLLIPSRYYPHLAHSASIYDDARSSSVLVGEDIDMSSSEDLGCVEVGGHLAAGRKDLDLSASNSFNMETQTDISLAVLEGLWSLSGWHYGL